MICLGITVEGSVGKSAPDFIVFCGLYSVWRCIN